ncbi:prepilin peptidase [Aestuariibius sp. 2305UL40-4]|uniref:prepilin peptidase n=1 Tax=Aestuariibius violaceus TaxID=3234132 RepID=UPI00345E63E2
MTPLAAAILAQIAIANIFVSTPARLALRAALRKAGGRPALRWTTSLQAGLTLGLSAAIWLQFSFGGAPLLTAAIAIALLLAACDLAWRWLPPGWSIALAVLGIFATLDGQSWLSLLAGIASPALTLLALRQTFLTLRGVEALGLGDVWLAAAIGAWLDPMLGLLALGLAALSGLAAATITRLLTSAPPANPKVAFGSHLCFAFLLLLNFV